MTYIIVNQEIHRDSEIETIFDNISIALLLKKSETKFHIIKKNTLMDQKKLSKILN